MSEPQPRLKRDWVGRKVKTLRELRNGNTLVPAGTVMEVSRNHSGLWLMTDGCSHCGVRVFITKVPMSDVELMPR